MLKGAQLFTVWHPVPHRITRDIDLLGFGNCEVADLVAVFRDLCTVAVDDDGIFFDPDSVIGGPIRADELYVGVRVSFLGKIGGARLPMQVDVGFGDSLAAQPVEVSFPSRLDMTGWPHRRILERRFAASRVDCLLAQIRAA